MKMEVTERDFRSREFKDAKVEDYEFDGEGKVVRKDRWQRAIERIRHHVGVGGRTYEIEHVVNAVLALRHEQAIGIDIKRLKHVAELVGLWHTPPGEETTPDRAGDMVDNLLQYVASLIEAGDAVIAPMQLALEKRCYIMSEPHLSGHRLIIGFEHPKDLQDAHQHIAQLARVDTGSHDG